MYYENLSLPISRNEYAGLFVSSVRPRAQDAQSSLTNDWITPLDTDNARISARVQDKAKRFKDKKLYRKMQYIKLKSVADAQQDGILTVTVPESKIEYHVKATNVEAEDKFNYVWSGEVIELPGSITTVSTKEQINAHLTLDGTEYEINPLGDDVYAMVERGDPEPNVEECPDVEVAKGIKIIEDEGSTNGRETGCTPRVVRVLILSTAAARARNADIVVCFVNGPGYGGTRGEVDAIGPSFNDAFAVVRVDFATNGYSFAHEVGHLYGAQHEDCAMWNNPPCIAATAGTFEHGSNFTRNGSLFRKTRRYHTLMHRLMGGDWQRVPNFSNPDVTYDTRATGGVEYDNAREIERTDFTVASFNRNEDLVASIDGPTSVNLYENNTWEAVFGCGNNYTFQWETSNDGFNYYSAGTGETMSRSVYDSNVGTIYIRVRVTSAGRSISAFRTVYVNGSNFRNGIASSNAPAWDEDIEVIEDNGILLNEVYPNPSYDKGQISFYLPEQEHVALDIVDISGKLMKNVISGDFEAGSYEFEVDLHSLAAGLYLYRLKAGEAQLTKRLMIQKK